MSRPENRGRIIWVLASSRPDLIEVDLKRPGRVDVKIPIFPTATPEESWQDVAGVAGQGPDLGRQQPHRAASAGGSSGTLPSVKSLIVWRRASRVTKPRARLTSPRGRACSSLRKSSR